MEIKEIERAKKAPKVQPKPPIDPQLTQELIKVLNKRTQLDIRVVKDLIKRGADIKAKNKWEATVIHWASWFGDMELVKECLQAGVDVNAKDSYDTTPLPWAVETDNIELVKYLIASGADVNAKDSIGYTPLHWTKSEEMEALLRRHVAII